MQADYEKEAAEVFAAMRSDGYPEAAAYAQGVLDAWLGNDESETVPDGHRQDYLAGFVSADAWAGAGGSATRALIERINELERECDELNEELRRWENRRY